MFNVWLVCACEPATFSRTLKVTQIILPETHGIKSLFSKAMIAAGISTPENYLHSVFPFKCDVTFILNSACLLYALIECTSNIGFSSTVLS